MRHEQLEAAAAYIGLLVVLVLPFVIAVLVVVALT